MKSNLGHHVSLVVIEKKLFAGHTEEKISVPRVYEHGNVIRRLNSHGRADSVYKPVHRHLQKYAAQIGRISCGPGALQGSIPGETEKIQGDRQSVNWRYIAV